MLGSKNKTIWFAVTNQLTKESKLHYFIHGAYLTLCNNVIYKEWFTMKYETIERALGPVSNPFPRQGHECRECYDALLKLKLDFPAEEKVSRNTGESTFTNLQAGA